MGRIRFRLSLKITLVVTTILVLLFSFVTVFVTSRMNDQLKTALINQTKSFATLSTRPIGDAFLLYQDSGVSLLRHEIDEITASETYLTNTVISDVTGKVLYEHKPGATPITASQAATYEPIYMYDKDGYASQVIYPFIEQNNAHRYTLSFSIDSSSLKQSLQDTQQRVIGILLVILLMANLALVLSIELFFIRPLSKLSLRAGFISEGNYDQRIALKRNDEVGDLSKAVDTMAAKLKDDIVRLKALDKAKTEFIVITSHNLRTPISILEGYLDLLKDMPEPHKAREYVKTMEQNAHQLHDLSEEMLLVAQVETGQWPSVNLNDFAVGQLFEEVVSHWRPVARKEQLDFVAENHVSKHTQMHSNFGYIRKILMNILDNSFKFTKQGIVRFSIKQQGNYMVFTVSDTGVGIVDAEKPNLFTKFHRGTDTLKYEYEGVGIGLYTAKLLAEALGGSISVSSKEREGTEVTIHIPVLSMRHA